MKRWKAILAAGLIFTMGAATGALAWRAAVEAGRERRVYGAHPTMLDARFNVLERMEKDLALTPEQSRRIASILEEGRKCTRTLWDSVAPQMREETKRVRDRIRAELTPEQRDRYEELIKQSREKHGSKSGGDRRPSRPDEPDNPMPPPVEGPGTATPKSLP